MPDPDMPATVVAPAAMREVLGHFVSGITVVTALADGGPTGFTCQAFSSLSLDPPLVAFAPSRTSRTWPRLRAIGRFCVNVLAEGQEGISRRFARSGTDKFAEVPWTPSPHGSPVLEGVLAWIDAQLWAEYDGGDHTIVVAAVRALAADPQRHPLIRYRGRYGRLPAVD
jgi:flavin reductase (DIM6/NTAB) family NADH-FMN oxidoreductase RutF